MINEIKIKDTKFGLKSEDKVYELLKTKFKNLEKSKNKYCCYDFLNDDTYIELKSRRNNKDKYKTSMLGNNKIKFFTKNNDKRCFVFFNYFDGLYYFIVNEENLKKCRIGKGGRYDRGKKEIDEICFIPNYLLNPYHTLNNQI